MPQDIRPTLSDFDEKKVAFIQECCHEFDLAGCDGR